ncbi:MULTISPECIES: GNAT family N-acetyltransferase [unclassified Gordonia (in: high G+C Gram-positive bacteria)]
MTTDKTGAQTSVSEIPAAQRYEISVDEQVAGLAAYRDRDHDGVSERVFYHTEVPEEFGGRGLATILVTEALDDTRAQGKTIIGVCPMVAAFLKKHTEYADATAPVTPEVINWLSSVTT